jgi:membrane protease YdiL (CAAX protease family)
VSAYDNPYDKAYEETYRNGCENVLDIPIADLTQTPLEQPRQPSIDAVGPNMGHTAVLLIITAVLVSLVQVVMLIGARKLNIFGHHSLKTYALMLAHDARWLVPSEALGYAAVRVVAVPLFSVWWRRGFAEGVHWNLAAARKFFLRLALLGMGCGIGIGLLGNFLPMPKNPPIELDLLHSPVGAWMMFVFGVTCAPLFEELCFRGFLLPAFVNAFRWLSLKGDLSPQAVRRVGYPVSALLTSLPFALMHSPQVSHAWGPLALIGLVSLVLCAVRLRLNSLAGSTIVHAAYNFTLFAGMLIATDGFRHLEKLTH